MNDLFTKVEDLAIVVKKAKPALKYMPNASASQVARLVAKGARIIGLTRGQFSLIDLIYSILKNTGAADVVCCTWSAGIKDANTVKWMMDTSLVKSFMLVTDHSYVTRKSQYILGISDLFGLENIRTAEIHAKFVLIKNEKFTICIRTSMNLNANRTCESFEIDEDADIYGFYANFINSTFKETPKGFVADSATVNKALDRTFWNLTQQFDWQNNG